MPRGGARAGAGRPKGARNRAKAGVGEPVDLRGEVLSLLVAAARGGSVTAALRLERITRPATETPPGKREVEAEAARAAAAGETGTWGDLLRVPDAPKASAEPQR